MTIYAPCDALRANALQDALTDALQAVRESVIDVDVTQTEAPEQPPPPLPGSVEAVAQARAYVLAQCDQGDCIDCRVIYRLTAGDAPRIRRFVMATQDAIRADQGVRGRGRPKASG